MAANYTRLDLRQTIERDTLQMATGAAGSLGDAVARGLDKEVTRPYYFTVTGTSRVLTVAGAGRIQNAESLVSHVNPSIIGVNDPLSASFTITFPSTSGSSATSTLTLDSGATVTVSSNNYINVGINLSPAGNLALTYGSQNTVAASAGAPAVPAGYWGIGYAQLFNNAGTIANLSNASLFHYDASRFSPYLSAAKTVSISSNVTLTDNAIHFVDTSAARSLTLPAPSKSSYIMIKDSTGSAASNNITVVRFGSEKIENVAASYTLNVSKGSWALVSDGTDWFVVQAWAGSSTVSTATSSATGVVTSYIPIIKNTINTVSSTNYTILDADGYDTINVSTGASQRTITLPAASTNAGRTIKVKKTDSGSGGITVAAAGADTIDGAASVFITVQYGNVTVSCTGSGWTIVGTINNLSVSQIITGGTYVATYTSNNAAVVTSGNITTVGSTHYSRIGNIVTVSGAANCNASSGGVADFDIALPLASTLSSVGDATGTAIGNNTDGTTVSSPGGYVKANTSTNAARIVTTIPNSGSAVVRYIFQYEIK